MHYIEALALEIQGIVLVCAGWAAALRIIHLRSSATSVLQCRSWQLSLRAPDSTESFITVATISVIIQAAIFHLQIVVEICVISVLDTI